MIACRLDRRLQGRIDPSDVLQEVFLIAARDMDVYLRQSPIPFYLWLRGIASNKLLEMHRYHLGTPLRDARREVSLTGGLWAEASSLDLADQLLGELTPPSEAAVRSEIKAQVESALDSLSHDDREILILRHFEQLTSSEAAHVLGIQERAASKRHLRALGRLRALLANTPGRPQRSGL
jgi:RNA polymerase sigma-70 factor (ECF subfamily)